jgi:hypothetical protein
MRICFFGDSFVNGTGDDGGLSAGKVTDSARRSTFSTTRATSMPADLVAKESLDWWFAPHLYVRPARVKCRPTADGALSRRDVACWVGFARDQAGVYQRKPFHLASVHRETAGGPVGLSVEIGEARSRRASTQRGDRQQGVPDLLAERDDKGRNR